MNSISQRGPSVFRTARLVFQCAAIIGVMAGPIEAMAQPNISGPSWFLVDGESGQVLAEHNADTPRQPASLTKLMTAYLVLGALKQGTLRWDEQVTVSAEDVRQVGKDESRMYLVPGQKAYVRDLVRGLIVASANDAALVLAHRVGGSISEFEVSMNDMARHLGMTESHFATPSGVTTPGNYSTAHDLATLSIRLTADFPEYYQFSSQQHFSYGSFSKRNKNWLLSSDPSVDGLKTGRTQAAGWCIVATARRNQADPSLERRVFAVVMDSPSSAQRIADAHRLIEYAYGSFKDFPSKLGHGIVTRPSGQIAQE
ncbi:D-alanyl-D-alanine carboxypeptidase [Paraburkholderia xenovorans]|uniref:D-alanyl-D-alanine carboxypeptidase family protein n=1 Tax=Paraburkholderia xenovorans TaxID=36873 RepID=UPI0038BA240A